MYKGKFVAELSMNEVKEYYDELRQKYPLTDEQRADFNILKEKLIAFACKTLEQEPILDKIRAEIYLLSDSRCDGTTITIYSWNGMKRRVLEIIDKYKEESEVKE